MNGIPDMEKCLIEQTKRSRVKGSDPSRRELKAFEKIGTLPQILVDQLIQLSEDYKQNDLGGDTYDISKHCNFEQTFNATSQNYRQIILQTKQPEDQSQTDEYSYTQWVDHAPPELIEYINSVFGKVYRFRMSVMAPGHELNWHIDTDPSVICRSQICLNQTDSILEFKTKSGHHELKMEVGGIYFINTGWSHRVVNSSDSVRRVCIFGFRYSEIPLEIQKTLHI
jgi:hypothetical protein